jgi:hypothetical protein
MYMPKVVGCFFRSNFINKRTLDALNKIVKFAKIAYLK